MPRKKKLRVPMPSEFHCYFCQERMATLEIYTKHLAVWHAVPLGYGIGNGELPKLVKSYPGSTEGPVIRCWCGVHYDELEWPEHLREIGGPEAHILEIILGRKG